MAKRAVDLEALRKLPIADRLQLTDPVSDADEVFVFQALSGG